MRMLDINVREIKDLVKLTEEEAFEYLNEWVHVVCRVNSREFLEISNTSELQQSKRLKEQKIYEFFQLFLMPDDDEDN